MLDLQLVWFPDLGGADFAIANGDLALDETLGTPVLLSLMCDQQAPADATLPVAGGSLRGWWGDDPSDPGGSLVWLLERAVMQDQTLAQAQSYAADALQWMIDDGVVGSVEVTASSPQTGWIDLAVEIDQTGASTNFAAAWALTMASPSL